MDKSKAEDQAREVVLIEGAMIISKNRDHPMRYVYQEEAENVETSRVKMLSVQESKIASLMPSSLKKDIRITLRASF